MLAPGGDKHRAFFVEGPGGWGVAGHPDRYPLAKVCHGAGVPWHGLHDHVGIKVPAGTILMLRRGMYGGVARVPPELGGLAPVVDSRQVEEYAP